MNRKSSFSISIFICMALRLTLLATAQPPETAAKEASRLRVANIQYGKIEFSTDAGKTYHLVGRVLTAAATVFPLKDVQSPGTVFKSNKDGIVFVVAPGMSLKLRPQHTASASRPSTTEPGAIISNLKAGESLFGKLLPAVGSAVRLQTRANSLSAFPTIFAPSDSDLFVFVATSEEKENQEAKAERDKQIETLSKGYRDKATERAKTEKRTVANGTLTLRAKLPPNEPDPIAAVIYLIDGELAAIQNAPPYLYPWDTRRVPDGEYAVEIRGMNKQGNIVTKVRALVAVDNGKR